MAEEIKKEEVVEIPAKFQDLVAQIEKMSVLELSELVKILEKKFGVSAAAPVMAMGVASATVSGGAEGAEEKTSFNVELKDCGAQKIQVIKVVREITGKGLKDAKDLVDSAPSMIKEGATKDEANDIKKKVEEAGGKVELK
ncbi:MAG: 50S ribosomal protein L7/L12 [Patescibacteria group bacterium]